MKRAFAQNMARIFTNNPQYIHTVVDISRCQRQHVQASLVVKKRVRAQMRNNKGANPSLCPKKALNQAKQAGEQAKKDVQVARPSTTSGKVEDTEGDEH
ncbi:hypothetical protein SARC_08684 [Sphaeroforma arctica JP610]|uniref:Uncharacterized protein n=1 Tax=Sphaeroforma arctica JP610 TaxID=667725 RepID=A0A0L0FQC0_9EUKA|nr:hypothetical protein SARC_08684 [Sphaeroforma arctica JP610]KNC78899.1 hypothetical protein SARC_08684 [Sphaeroforma arctica JP610]|eukprot:XP_014152801.1 hypothetical protein SARC_08684 [Sphaeroforma arctica JP610]